MRGVVLNESEILEKKEKYINEKPIVTIGIIVRNSYEKGMDKEQVVKEVHEIMEKCYVGYKPSKWEKIIDSTSKLYEKKLEKHKLIDVDSISITESEWSAILKLNNEVLERLAFIMLVYQKISKIKNPNSDNWINQSIGDIFKEAKVSYKGDKQKMLLNELYKRGYIKQPNICYGTSFQILFVDENSNVKIRANSFENVITYYYENKLNKKYKACEVCGIRFEISNYRQKKKKYCKKCSKEKNKELAKISMRNKKRFK